MDEIPLNDRELKIIDALAKIEVNRTKLQGLLLMIDSHLCRHKFNAYDAETGQWNGDWWVGHALDDRQRLIHLLEDNGIDPTTGLKNSI